VNVLVQVLVAKMQELLQKKKCKHCWWVLGTELLRELTGKEG
jgi:hypothetical protein